MDGLCFSQLLILCTLVMGQGWILPPDTWHLPKPLFLAPPPQLKSPLQSVHCASLRNRSTTNKTSNKRCIAQWRLPPLLPLCPSVATLTSYCLVAALISLILLLETSEDRCIFSGSGRTQYSGNFPSLWVRRAQTRWLWPRKEELTHGNLLVAARRAARRQVWWQGRP